MSQIYENNRPDEYTTGWKMLNDENSQPREKSGYINEQYTDIRPIYMPPVAIEIMEELKQKDEYERKMVKE